MFEWLSFVPGFLPLVNALRMHMTKGGILAGGEKQTIFLFKKPYLPHFHYLTILLSFCVMPFFAFLMAHSHTATTIADCSPPTRTYVSLSHLNMNECK